MKNCMPVVMLLVLSSLEAQEATKKSFVFHGQVVDVNRTTKRLVVHNENIEGWMGEMTMAFAVDDPSAVDRVKAGDQITATVYEGDFTLHDVRVVPQTAAPSQGGPAGMKLEQFEQMALANNPSMAQVQANLRIANGLARQAGLYPNPTVGYYGDEIRGGYVGGGKQGGFLSQNIVLGGKLHAARRVAELQAEETGTSAEVQKQRILNDVRSWFYHVLAAQRLVDVRQSLVKLASDATQTSLQLGNVGQADRPDILEAEVEQQQATVSLRVAEQNLKASWRVLAAVAGKPDLPQAHVDGNLEAVPDLDYQEWLAATLRDSPAVKLARQSIDTAEATLVQARKVPIPDLQFTGILAQNYEPLETTRKPTGLEGGAQLGVQLPVFNRNQGNIAAARAGIESAKQDLARIQLHVQRELADMFRDYDGARVTIRQFKAEMLPRAEQAYKLYQANYMNMAGAYPQVLISQRTLFQLEADYVQALDNAWQSIVLIRGFGLMDSLSEPVSPMGMMQK